jgi:hypothetical protein
VQELVLGLSVCQTASRKLEVSSEFSLVRFVEEFSEESESAQEV